MSDPHRPDPWVPVTMLTLFVAGIPCLLHPRYARALLDRSYDPYRARIDRRLEAERAWREGEK